MGGIAMVRCATGPPAWRDFGPGPGTSGVEVRSPPRRSVGSSARPGPPRRRARPGAGGGGGGGGGGGVSGGRRGRRGGVAEVHVDLGPQGARWRSRSPRAIHSRGSTRHPPWKQRAKMQTPKTAIESESGILQSTLSARSTFPSEATPKAPHSARVLHPTRSGSLAKAGGQTRRALASECVA